MVFSVQLNKHLFLSEQSFHPFQSDIDVSLPLWRYCVAENRSVRPGIPTDMAYCAAKHGGKGSISGHSGHISVG